MEAPVQSMNKAVQREEDSSLSARVPLVDIGDYFPGQGDNRG